MRLLVLLVACGLPVLAQTTQAPPHQPGELQNTIPAPPLTNAEKFRIRVVEEFTIRGLAGNALGAALGQFTNTPSEWGQGTQGYAIRYASGVGNTLSRQSMAWLIESYTHGDPRYFPSEEHAFRPRFVNAVKQIFFAKRDDGTWGFDYGNVISAFAAGQLVNTWQPHSTGSVADGFERGLITLGVDGAYNLGQGLFPFLRPKYLRHRH